MQGALTWWGWHTLQWVALEMEGQLLYWSMLLKLMHHTPKSHRRTCAAMTAPTMPMLRYHVPLAQKVVTTRGTFYCCVAKQV